MVNFMYIFEISLVEFIRNISVSKKHTLMNNSIQFLMDHLFHLIKLKKWLKTDFPRDFIRDTCEEKMIHEMCRDLKI